MKLFNSADLSGPLGLVEGGGGLRRARFPVRYGLIETTGLRMLVDTGFGPRVTGGRRSLPLRLYASLLRPKLHPFALTAVDAILITHFHADHIARLRDFPGARLLASRDAIGRLAAMTPGQATRHAVFPELLPDHFAEKVERIEFLPQVSSSTSLGDGYDLCGDASHLAIPLPGHAPGHFGVFWHEGGTPTLYATDVAWTLQALRAGTTPRFAQRAIFDDVAVAEATAAKVRRFAIEGGTVLLCHDPA